MSDREGEFLALYRQKRFQDQLGWYADRVDEYERAHDQSITVIGVAMFGASASGLAAAADLAQFRTGWAVLAAALSGLATLVSAYDQLIGFEANTKLYRDALGALGSLRARAPWLAAEPPAPETVASFVLAAEEVLQKERGQWGQLTGRPTAEASSEQPPREP
jgi:hypothetical protein